MNLVYGEIVELQSEGEMRVGKVRIRGALAKVSLDLLTAPQPSGKVLVCEGVAIGSVDEPAAKEIIYVSGHTR